MDEERVEEHFELALGHVTTAPDGRRWIFTGWGDTSTGKLARWVEEATGVYLGDARVKSIVGVKTMLRHFPDLAPLYQEEVSRGAGA